MMLFVKSFIRQAQDTKSPLTDVFFFCLLRDSHFLLLYSKLNFASCHGDIFEVSTTLMFHHDLLCYTLDML